MRGWMITFMAWVLLTWNSLSSLTLYYDRHRVDKLTAEFIQAKQHFERWQKTADAMLQENGYEPITPLLADK